MSKNEMDVAKTPVITFRVTKAEYEELRKKGAAQKLSANDFARQKVRKSLDLEVIEKRMEEEKVAGAEFRKAMMERLERNEVRLVSEFSSMVNEETITEIVNRAVNRLMAEMANKKQG